MIGFPTHRETPMRRVLFAVVLLVVGCGKAQQNAADSPAEPEVAPIALAPPPEDVHLHTEKGIRDQLLIEERSTLQYIVDRATEKPLMRAGQYTYHRFLIGGTLHGSQVRKHDRHILDDFQCLTAANPWDNIACLGAIQTFDMRQEPLTYHHRSGPIGAIYHELRTRKNGADAKAPVAILGMTAGEEACYALRGQKMTFYETDPAVVKLVADTDKYFSYVTDARKRSAEIEVRVGDKRAKLQEDKNRRYALIVVDLAESYPFPTDTFTKEAVQEYFDRLTDDGIVALHISNKWIKLEPMFAKMADELKLTARVWYDADERRHGKTASAWVILVRNEKALGTLDMPRDASKFRPLEPVKGIPVWTDASADVWILWIHPDLQVLRMFMGLPAPLAR
jgi:hypothetical protein